MPVQPKVRALIDAMEAAFPPLDPRKSGTQLRAEMKAAAAQAIPAGPPEPVGDVHDRELPGPNGPIPVRVYTPTTPMASPPPLVVFTHGGGWTLCDLDSHDGICRALCNAAGCVVVAVDYRLAPEHRFPVGVEDAYAATRHLAEHPDQVGAAAGQVALVGDSAGGNLAAVVALMARDRGGPAIGLQVLVYPVIDHSDDTSSHRGIGPGYYLRSEEVMYFWDQYLADPADGAHPYASPIRAADLSGLPPALVVTAEYDPLRDEGEAYAAALQAAGVPATVHRYDGMFHSFFSFQGVLDEAAELRDEIAAAVRAAFAG